MWMKVRAFVARYGGVLGFLTTIVGALSGPPVLAYLPTKYAGALIVVGAVLQALTKPVAMPGRTQP